MNRLFILLGICCLAFGLDAQTLSVRDVISEALRNNASVQQAQQAVKRAQGNLREAKTGDNPKADITGRVTRNDKLDVVEIAPGQQITVGVLDQINADLGVTLPLDISGLTKASVDQAELGLAAAIGDYNAQVDTVALEAQRLYYDALLKEKRVRVAEAALARSQETKRIADVNFQAETGTRYDVMSRQSQLSQAEVNLVNARTDAQLAKSRLNDIMGRDPKTPVELEITEDVASVVLPQMDAMVEQALSARPEIAAAAARVGLAKKGVYLASSTMKPSFSLNWDLLWTDTTSTFAPRETRWVATADVVVPVFDGGVAGARKEQARAQEKSGQIALDQTKRLVEIDVQQAMYALEGAVKELEAARRGLEAAREAERLAQIRYREQVGTSVEVTDAQSALVQAETAEAQAIYGILQAQAGLWRAASIRWWEAEQR